MVRVKGQDLKRLDKLGDNYSRKVTRALGKVLNEVANGYESPEDIGVITDLWDAQVDNGLLEDLGEVWLDGAQHVRNQLTRQVELVSSGQESVVVVLTSAIEIPSVSDQGAIQYLLSRSNFLRNVAADAWELVRGTLIEGIQQGESVGEIKQRIREILGVASPRAEVIARTEVNGASNAGSYEQMKSSGLPATKEWLATNDSRTRHSHTEVDGQKVQLNEKFTVGGFPMDRPHDPAGPASEVVNCRCTILFDIPEDAFVEPDDLGPSLAAAGSETATVEHTGAMIALVPSEKDLDRLVLEGGEPREELHLTLWFLGEAKDIPEDIQKKIEDSIQTNAGDLDLPPIRGKAFGINHWNPDSDDPAWVLAVGNTSDDPVDLEDYKTLAGIALEGVDIPHNHTPWNPHVTVAYSKENLFDQIGQSRLGEITFDKIRLAFGNSVRDISLAKLQEQENEMPWSKVQNHADCPSDEPWAVVKDETGEVEGCHATEEEANRQLAALNASEDEESLGGKPNPGTKKDKRLEENLAEHPGDCPEGQHRMPDGECMPDEEMNAQAEALLDDIRDAEIVELDEKASWTGVLVVEGIATGDGREFANDSLVWEKLPIPLRWNKEDSHGGEPHTVAVVVGKINEIWRDGNNIMGKGIFDLGSEDGREAHRLVEQGFLSGISIDADDISEQDIEIIFPEDTGEDDMFMMPEKMLFHHGRIRAATLVDIPAFIEAEIDLDHILSDSGSDVPSPEGSTDMKVNEYFKEVVTASMGVDENSPPAEWFKNPNLSLLTGITVTDEGRIYGHAAEWNTCHVGIPDVCVTPPEEDLHPYFMTGEIVCSNGSRVGVGQLTVGTGHASLGLNAKKAAEHYDDTGAAVADVAVGNDEHGIWVAGAIRADADPVKVRDLMASGRVSGDWRRIGGQLRLVGLLAVNVPGFPIPQTKTRVASGSPLALVAAGQISIGKMKALDKKEKLEKQNLKAMAESIARRVGLDKEKE